MLWLNWRQYRWPLLLGALLLALLCVCYMSDGLLLYSLYNKLGLVTCKTNEGDCHNLFRAFSQQLTVRRVITPPSSAFILLLPLLMGVFVGAPLLPREQRTAPFMRTQSVTLRRWLMVKLGLIVLVTLIFSTVLSLIYTWWSYPMSAFMQDIWGNYESGIVLIGWSLFDLLLGVTIGALIRRPVPAMTVTFFLLLALALGSRNAYPYLIPPLSKLYPVSITQSGDAWGRPGDLSLYAGYADRNGRETGEISTYCGSDLAFNDYGYAAMANKCIKEMHLQWKVVYQPAERYWPLQILETSLLLVLSVALLPLIYWLWYRRLN